MDESGIVPPRLKTNAFRTMEPRGAPGSYRGIEYPQNTKDCGMRCRYVRLGAETDSPAQFLLEAAAVRCESWPTYPIRSFMV